MLAHLDRQHWLREARKLARSGAYASVEQLEEELREGVDYARAVGLLHDNAIRYQLKLLCDRAHAKSGRGTALTQVGAPG